MKLRASHLCLLALVASVALVAHVRGDITGVLGRPAASPAPPVPAPLPLGAGVPQVGLYSVLFHLPPPAREALLCSAVRALRE